MHDAACCAVFLLDFLYGINMGRFAVFLRCASCMTRNEYETVRAGVHSTLEETCPNETSSKPLFHLHMFICFSTPPFSTLGYPLRAHFRFVCAVLSTTYPHEELLSLLILSNFSGLSTTVVLKVLEPWHRIFDSLLEQHCWHRL